MLAADPTDPRFVVLANRLDAVDFSCALQLSGDGGHTWIPTKPVPKLPPGAEKCYAPEVGFDRRGRLYYLFVGLAGRTNTAMGAFLTSSDDRGRTFSRPRRVLGPRNFMVRMAIDTTAGDAGRIHLVWLAGSGSPGLGSMPPPPNPIVAAHSDDGGRSFSDPVQVSAPQRERVVAPALALGPNGGVHVVYYDLGDDAVDYHGLEGPTWDGKWTVLHTRSSDGGRSFGSSSVVDDDIVPPDRVMLIFTMTPPSLVVDEKRVFTAWHDARHGDWDVFVRRSDDRGRTWAAPTRVNDDPVGNKRHQYLPRLASTPSGRLDVLFYDRREDPENAVNDVRFSFSDDRGATFSRNIKLTAFASDSRIGQSYLGPAAKDQVEFGSRLGLLSTDRVAVAAWTDTRNSMFPIQQDIFSAQVLFSGGDAPARSRWVPFTATVTTGSVIAAGVLLRRRRRSRRPTVDADEDPQ